jgi:hypothetical protein
MIHADIVLKQTGEKVLTGGAIVTVRIVAARLAPVLLRCKMGIGVNQTDTLPNPDIVIPAKAGIHGLIYRHHVNGA